MKAVRDTVRLWPGGAAELVGRDNSSSPAEGLVSSDGASKQLPSLSTAIALQVIGSFLVVAIIIFVFWFRRRKQQQHSHAERLARLAAATNHDKPHIGYRQTILGIPVDERKVYRHKGSASADARIGGTRGNPWAGAYASMNSEPVELPDESTLLRTFKKEDRASWQVHNRRKTIDDGYSTISSESSASAIRIHKWLPELPEPTLSRPSSTRRISEGRRSQYADATVGTTPTLAEIHERLTTTGAGTPDVRAPPPLTEDSRWSATTHSSVFTAFSSRSSGAAYMSSLRPPPLRRQTHMDPLPESRLYDATEVPLASPEPASKARMTLQIKSSRSGSIS